MDWIGPKVNDKKILQISFGYGGELKMFFMNQVSISVFFWQEGQQKDVGAALVQSFGAAIGSPLERMDHRNFRHQTQKIFLDTRNSFLGSFILKSERNDMA